MGHRRDPPHGPSDRQLREPEIEELDARRREHDVAGFDIPVHDAMPVSERDGVGERGRVPQRLGHGQRSLQQPLGSVSPSRYSMTKNSTSSWSPTS